MSLPINSIIQLLLQIFATQYSPSILSSRSPAVVIIKIELTIVMLKKILIDLRIKESKIFPYEATMIPFIDWTQKFKFPLILQVRMIYDVSTHVIANFQQEFNVMTNFVSLTQTSLSTRLSTLNFLVVDYTERKINIILLYYNLREHSLIT